MTGPELPVSARTTRFICSMAVIDILQNVVVATRGNCAASAISPDGRWITVWSCQNWKLLHRLSGHQSAVHAAGISADGKTLATGDEQGLIKLWDFAGGRELLEMVQPVAGVIGLQFSPDGQKLIAWDQTLTITILQSPDYRQRPPGSP